MKLSRVRNVVLGMLLMALVMTAATPAMASVKKRTLDVDYLDIKLVVDGKEVIPRDANGKVVEPFAYNGTTYLPVRAVGEALGKTVRWDGETKTVHLGEMPQGTYLVDVCKPAKTHGGYLYRAADHDYFTSYGKRYSQGFILEYGDETFELGGKYESLTFDLDANNRSYSYCKGLTAYLWVYLDGKFAHTIEATIDGGMQTVTVPLNYARTISFRWQDPDGKYQVSEGRIANAVLNGERTVTKPVSALPTNATYLVDVYDGSRDTKYKAAEEKYFEDIFGNKYTNGILLEYSGTTANLNGVYKTLKATIVRNESIYKNGDMKNNVFSVTYKFSVDGEIVAEIEVSNAMPSQTIEIPLNYGMKLDIRNDDSKTGLFIADAILE